MKNCPMCKTSLPFEAFNKNSSRPDGLGSNCRECQKKIRKRHYTNNSQKVFSEVRARKQRLQDYIWSVKNNSQCKDCGESNPIVLEFDHIGDKEFNISAAVTRGLSQTRIAAEIAKCEVVCANCHRIRTHTRGKWVRNIGILV